MLEKLTETLLTPLAVFGFAAQFVFMSRFVVQWYVSERARRSMVPEAFWWLSLVGGLMLGLYALLRQDPVFVAGQGLGVTIYTRNLILIHRRRRRVQQRRAARADDQVAPPTAAAIAAEDDQTEVIPDDTVVLGAASTTDDPPPADTR